MGDPRQLLRQLAGTRNPVEVESALADLRAEAKRDPGAVRSAVTKETGAAEALDRIITGGGAQSALAQGLLKLLEAAPASAKRKRADSSDDEGKKKKKKKKSKEEEAQEKAAAEKKAAKAEKKKEAELQAKAAAEEEKKLNTLAAKLLRGAIGGEAPCFLSLRRFTGLQEVAWEIPQPGGGVKYQQLIGGGVNNTDSSLGD